MQRRVHGYIYKESGTAALFLRREKVYVRDAGLSFILSIHTYRELLPCPMW